MDYRDASTKILWHGTMLGQEQRLRFLSFIAEQFWKLAFKERQGLNALHVDSVKSVWLSGVKINGRRFDSDKEFIVPPEDSAMALKIATAVVVLLDDLDYRILDAIVPAPGGGEHDFLAERRNLPRKSSVEVKCKRILHEATLFGEFRQLMRKDALKLWRPSMFSERVLILVEFGCGSLESGWRIMRCEKYDARQQWKSLCGWPGGLSQLTASSSVVGSGSLKRKQTSTPAERMVSPTSSGDTSSKKTKNSGPKRASAASDEQWVLIAGLRYVTLPWYLGRPAVKSQQQIAAACCSSGRAELQNGNWSTLTSYWGQEVLEEEAFSRFRQHKWTSTLCSPSKPERGSLQVKLLKESQEPSSSKFLWNLEELQNCKALRK